MTRRFQLLAFGAILALAACSPMAPIRVGMMSAEELQTVQPHFLCNAYGAGRYKKVRAEMERRGVLTADEWALVDAKRIRVGMSTCAALAAWGPPAKVNRASYGNQWVYQYCQSCTASYLYTRGGRIIGYN